MPTFEFTSPEGKTYEVQGPDGATKEQAFSMLQKQLGAPAPSAAPLPADPVNQIPGMERSVDSQAAPSTPLMDQKLIGGHSLNDAYKGVKDALMGPSDAVISLGANAVMAPIAAASGVARSLFGGKYGTQEGVKQGEDFANRVQSTAYQPKTKAGKEILDRFNRFMDKSMLGAVVPEMPKVASIREPVAMQVGTRIGETAADLIPRKPQPKPGMIGVGAAETEKALQRKTEAGSLPVPIPLTKGQQTRDFDQLKFEKETAKNGGVGAPLRNRYAEQNEGIHKNLDAFDEATNSQKRSLREVGDTVLNALAEKDAAKSKAITEAYNKARAAGQMKEPVPVKALTDYLAENRSSEKNAPILSAVQAEIKRLSSKPNPEGWTDFLKGKMGPAMREFTDKGMSHADAHSAALRKLSAEYKGGGERVLSINDMENLRQFINKTMNETGPDMKFAPELKKIIDATTEGKGGDLYRQARRLAENHAREFNDRAVIRDLMNMKKGDRKVAVEDVFQKSILSGSLDDVRHLRRVLQTGGEKGKQAWSELQGQTIRHLKEQVTKSVNIDQRGNQVVSAKAFNDLVRDLDKDGKLDFIFGKQGAEQIRTLNEISKDVLTVPEGAVNHSNTASAVAAMLDGLTMVGSHYAGHFLPAPVFSVGNFARNAYKNKQLAARVADALDEPIRPKQ